MRNNFPEIEVDEEVESAVEELIESTKGKTIVVYNDDVNSFEHVIMCFLKYCDHNMHQAEQCAQIIHYNGKCDVKRGTLDKLTPIHEALLENGLRSKIEES